MNKIDPRPSGSVTPPPLIPNYSNQPPLTFPEPPSNIKWLLPKPGRSITGFHQKSEKVLIFHDFFSDMNTNFPDHFLAFCKKFYLKHEMIIVTLFR